MCECADRDCTGIERAEVRSDDHDVRVRIDVAANAVFDAVAWANPSLPSPVTDVATLNDVPVQAAADAAQRNCVLRRHCENGTIVRLMHDDAKRPTTT